MTPLTPRMRLAVAQLVLALLLGGGIWVGLPARYLPVDLGGSALALLCATSGLALLAETRHAFLIARITSWTTLVLGCAVTSALAFVVAHLSGFYGPVGSGGALLMATIALLVLPYLVGLPLLQLSWLVRADERDPARDADRAPAPPREAPRDEAVS